MTDPPPEPTPAREPRGNWAALFQQTTDAIFLLNPRGRLRYVNRAWTAVTKTAPEAALHEYCLPRKIKRAAPAALRALLQAMAPPADAWLGRTVTVRRPVPPAKLGPPWWDITFVPFREGDRVVALVGIIVIVPTAVVAAEGSKARGLPEPLVALREKVAKRFPLSRYADEASAMRRIAARADLASRSRSPVWLVGGPGTGKETLARAIHFHGITREQSFIGIDCAGLQPYLIMSLLFGHNGLAETGRVGTVYLRSPEAMPADLQAELVEWHQMTDEVPRVVVGTTGAAGLSEDFRATFGVIEIALPLLAERKPELPRILAEVLDEERAAGVPTAGCASDAEAVLMAWTWPGNLREFRDTVRGAARLAEGSRIEVAHLPHAVRRGVAEASAANSGAVPALTAPKLDAVLEQVERRMIDLALRKSKGDQTAAAELLGVYRSRLVRRIKALGIG